ncbi:MAG TPA: hypothetical protein VMV32_04600, partial [Ignavibacteriaceae bacterium]|nr:hypothetical protein [Ignavibacteriaceae bacterium]
TLSSSGIEDGGTYNFTADELVQIQLCIDWLKTKKIQKTINRRASSYGIKHIIERELGTYIASGCFIAAVIHLGIPYKRMGDSFHISVAISSKELHKNDKNIK